MSFKLKPGSETVKIERPTGAKPLDQVLNEMGYPELAKQVQELSAAQSAALPVTGPQ
jgi:hypothetical protein